MDRRWYRAVLVSLVFALFALWGYRLLAVSTADPDMFWRIVEGRWILDHRSIPTTDVLSWYRTESPSYMTPQTWLFEVGLALVYGLGGFRLVYALSNLLYAAVVPLVYLLARARSAPPLTSLIVATVAATGAIQAASPRPQLLSFILLLLVALFLERGWWLPALLCVAIGANVHAGVWPIYVLLVAFYCLRTQPLVVVGAVLAAAATPVPLGGLLHPFKTVLTPSTQTITEFVPLTPWQRPFDLAVIVGLLFLLKRARVPWWSAAFLGVLTVLALSGVRHVAWFYLLGLPVLAPYLVGAGSDEQMGPDARTDQDAPPASVRTALLDGVLLGALSFGVAALAFVAFTTPVDVDRGYPKEMTAYLKQHPAERLLNRFEEGGYLMLNGVEPMLDTRCEPFTGPGWRNAGLLGDYFSARVLLTDPREFLDRYDIRTVMTPKDSPLARALANDPRCTVVHEDETHVLYSYTRG